MLQSQRAELYVPRRWSFSCRSRRGSGGSLCWLRTTARSPAFLFLSVLLFLLHDLAPSLLTSLLLASRSSLPLLPPLFFGLFFVHNLLPHPSPFPFFFRISLLPLFLLHPFPSPLFLRIGWREGDWLQYLLLYPFFPRGDFRGNAIRTQIICCHKRSFSVSSLFFLF